MKQIGIITSSVGGFYHVQTEQEEYVCKLRGRLRLGQDRVLVGDQVEFEPGREGQGTIDALLPRRSQLVRPLIANVDQVIVVLSFQDPAPDTTLLDRLLVSARVYKLNAVICLNKSDLPNESAQRLITSYRNIGYTVIPCSTKTRDGMVTLQEALQDTQSVLAGPSGVGKSSLLNSINPEFSLEEGTVSVKSKRGRHTTRSVRLLPLNANSFVADTPGFSQLNLQDVSSSEELEPCFPEIHAASQQCAFRGCTHETEPGCAVQEALAQDKIEPHRYQSYRALLQEIPRYTRRKT